HPHRDLRVHVVALIVRSAMDDGAAHGAHLLRRSGSAVEREDSGDAAHGRQWVETATRRSWPAVGVVSAAGGGSVTRWFSLQGPMKPNAPRTTPLITAGEKSPSGSRQECSQSSCRGIVSSGCRGSRWRHVV